MPADLPAPIVAPAPVRLCALCRCEMRPGQPECGSGLAHRECSDAELEALRCEDITGDGECWDDYAREVPAEPFPSDSLLAAMADYDVAPAGW